MLLSRVTSTAPENWGLPFHGPGPHHADRHSEVSRGAPLPWRHNGISLQKPQCLLSVLCVLQTWLHPTSWPWGCGGPAWPWDSALVPAWWGTGQAPGDRVLHAMPALSVATKSQRVPAGCASLRDALWDPSWP